MAKKGSLREFQAHLAKRLAARIAQARVDVQQTLLQLTQVDPPRARR